MKDMNETMQARRAAIFKSLADETRLSIVRKLAEESCEVKGAEIINSCAEFHKLSQPAMSHHFQKLVAADVLIEHKEGVSKSYELNYELLTSVGVDASKL